MKNLTDLAKTVEIEFGGFSEASDMVQNPTAEKIQDLAAKGYQIKVGNNPHLEERAKYEQYDKVRISQVNSTRHGKSIRTIWGVKPS